MSEKVMTPQAFAERINAIRQEESLDIAHEEADDLMADLLIALGYGDGIEIFKSMNKWYS